jgi:hypothetical protein
MEAVAMSAVDVVASPSGEDDVPDEEAQRAAACIEKLGGPGGYEQTEYGYNNLENTVVRAPSAPTGRRVVFVRSGRELVVELEPFAAALEQGRRGPEAEALRAGAGDEVRFDRLPRPSGGTWDDPDRINSVLGDFLETHPFVVRDPTVQDSDERMLVRNKYESRSGGRSGEGARRFYATDCTELLLVVDWIS